MSLITDSFLATFHSISFEKITDHPNILIAARFWDDERYESARTCYKFMRAIDDLIDNNKTNHRIISDREKQLFNDEVEKWINSICNSLNAHPAQRELMDTVEKFRIPLWPMKVFARSMIYDIYHDGFPTLQAFLDYSEGATVAPASIFVHLCCLTKQNGLYHEPEFDLKKIATPCALFSYFVHIIRDFEKDQRNNLNYFADDLVAKHGLDRAELKKIALGGDLPQGFRDLVQAYYVLADGYRIKTRAVIQEIAPMLEPRYRLSLEIIFNLYLMVFERIDVVSGTFRTAELTPTPNEIRERVYDTIMNFKTV
ncbi:MAG: squalene/phytoene synthase family protein [Bacteroidota bacterium]|nr:squalene/phytoene synthase family protein [Bacteroidota bacterium]